MATHQSAGLVLGADRHPRDPAGIDGGIDVADCWFRMLGPREHLRAQRFGDDYIVLGNIGEQTAQAGNAVPGNIAQWIAERLREVL